MGGSAPINNKPYDIEEILCCKCGEITEILYVYTDNSKIELNCKKCGKYEILIDDYYDKLYKEYYFKKCSSCKNKGINNIEYFYCFTCNNNYCKSCKNKNHSTHHYIEENKNICFRHNKIFKYYCFDCEENFCEEEVEHKNHEIKEISDLAKSLDYDIIEIRKINEELENFVEFNETIIKYSEILKNNKYFLKSIINIGKSLKEGNERNSKDTKCLLSELSKNIKYSDKAIKEFGKKKDIELNRNDKYLNLNNIKLDNKDFKYISQIRFNQLKEIDISENDITNIEPFEKMSLPFLEFLNLSYNKINKIEPLTKLKSQNLQYIFLQRNKIEDLGTLLESNFPSLKILRIEDNNINEENKDEKLKEELKLIGEKYGERFIYKSMEEQIKEFKKKYHRFDISWDKKNIDLSDLRGGDEILKNLFLIITYKSKNIIEKLSLRNNDIKDPSMLSRINFKYLEKLDLSLNKIEDLKFLSNMNLIKLKYLFHIYLGNVFY